MFVPVPVDNSFLPYTKRVVRKRNAGLFVDAGGSGASNGNVVAQSADCFGKEPGTPCGYWNGQYHGTCNRYGGCEI